MGDWDSDGCDSDYCDGNTSSFDAYIGTDGVTTDLAPLFRYHYELFRVVNAIGNHPPLPHLRNPKGHPGIKVDLKAETQTLSGGYINFCSTDLVGGCCASSNPLTWWAHGPADSHELTLRDMADHLAVSTAPPPNRIYFNEYVAKVLSESLGPDGQPQKIQWMTEAGVWRLEPMPIGKLVPVTEWLERQLNPAEMVIRALESNLYVGAAVARAYPTVFDEPILGATGYQMERIRNELRSCLWRVPEVAEWYPAEYVLDNLHLIDELHRLPRSLYDTPAKFDRVFIGDGLDRRERKPGMIPWDYASSTFDVGAVSALAAKLANAHPYWLWATPLGTADRLTTRRINRWINAMEHLLPRLAEAKKTRDRRAEGILTEKVGHPAYARWLPPKVETESQFRRTVMAVGHIPKVAGCEAKPMHAPKSWWTEPMVDRVVEKIRWLKSVPRRFLTQERLERWVKENGHDYLEGFPKTMRTPELDELAVVEHSYCSHRAHLALYKSCERKTIPMAVALVKMHGESAAKELPLEVLLAPEVFDAMTKSYHASAWLYQVIDEAHHARVDEALLARNFSRIPEHRITDDLSRRAHISWWYRFTDTVKEERRIEYDRYDHFSRGYYWDHGCDDLGGRPSAAQCAVASECGFTVDYR